MVSPGDRYARRFQSLLQEFRKPDGSEWRGIDLEEATNGYVTGSYVTALKRGRIARPGLDKLRAISDAMGFSFSFWLEDPDDTEHQKLRFSPDSNKAETFADRINYLFEMIRDDITNEPFSNEYVANASRGKVSVDLLEGMRSGEIDNPGRQELLALCDVFDIDLTYWDLEKERPPIMGSDTINALRNSSSYAILHKSMGLPEADKDLIVAMMDQLQRRSSNSSSQNPS